MFDIHKFISALQPLPWLKYGRFISPFVSDEPHASVNLRKGVYFGRVKGTLCSLTACWSLRSGGNMIHPVILFENSPENCERKCGFHKKLY